MNNRCFLFAGKLLQGPSEVLEAISNLDAATADLRATLSDPSISSYRVVLQPEKMVMREAERAISYLGLFNYPVDSVIINRILPDTADDSEFNRRAVAKRKQPAQPERKHPHVAMRQRQGLPALKRPRVAASLKPVLRVPKSVRAPR